VHRPAANDRPDLGGAPCPSSHGGKLKALGVKSVLSRATYKNLCHNAVMDRESTADTYIP